MSRNQCLKCCTNACKLQVALVIESAKTEKNCQHLLYFIKWVGIIISKQQHIERMSQNVITN